ncbi:MAG: hypothetical protein MUC63_05080, partial [Planctomycetes bacterium]|nr:hypothetical protein [Planctomycetota bacterium]
LPGGGVTFEAAKKVFTDYFSNVLQCVRAKKEINGQEAMNAAARAGGFKDWADYATQAAQSLGPEQWKKLVDEVVRWYQKEMEKVTKEMTEEQGK